MNPLQDVAAGSETVVAWYLVQCKPRQDERAEEHLKRQSYAYYRPLVSRERLIRGRLLVMQESLFPGYIFIRLSANANWSALRSTRGVNRLVSFGGYPIQVSSGLIDSLRQRLSYEAAPLFTFGDKVRIVEGSFSELEAIFQRMDGEERVVLLMRLLHRQQPLNLPLASVRKK